MLESVFFFYAVIALGRRGRFWGRYDMLLVCCIRVAKLCTDSTSTPRVDVRSL